MLKKIRTATAIIALSSAAVFSTINTANASAPILGDLLAKGNTPSLAPMLKQVLPGVVNISVKGKKDVQGFSIPDEFKFMFPGMGDAFGLGEKPQQREFRALGSGVIISADEALVVTNNHVIDGADEIKVQLSDSREFNAKLIGRDSHTDLALLKLENAKNLTQIDMADSDTLEVGDFAIAIGNPYGLGQTVTSGIVSALGRSGLNIENIENFIQTDAAINSGNSGGALIDLNGKLIGINTAIMAPSWRSTPCPTTSSSRTTCPRRSSARWPTACSRRRSSPGSRRRQRKTKRTEAARNPFTEKEEEGGMSILRKRL